MATIATRRWHVADPDSGAAKAVGPLPQELARRLLGAMEGDLVVLGDDLAPVSRDLQPVRPGRVSRGRDEHARRPVGVLHEGGDVVFDFDVVVFSEVAERAHAGRHAADPLPQVEVVRALVGQHAAALAGPRGAPAAGVIVTLGPEPGGDDVVGALDLTQFA